MREKLFESVGDNRFRLVSEAHWSDPFPVKEKSEVKLLQLILDNLYEINTGVYDISSGLHIKRAIQGCEALLKIHGEKV